MRINVNAVPSVKPPMTVIANGAPITETYSAVPNANGTMATMVVIAVIKIGRNR